MYMINTENKECTEDSHAFKIMKLKEVRGNYYCDIPDNTRCTCGEMLYGDLVK